MSSFRLGTKLDTPGWNGQNGPAAARPTVGLKRKKPPKMRFKNSWNWLVLLMLATVFTNIEYQVQRAMTGNGNQMNLQKLGWKIFVKSDQVFLFLAGFNYLKPLCALLLQHCQQPTNSHQIMSQTLHSKTTIWSVLVKKKGKGKKSREIFWRKHCTDTKETKTQKPNCPTFHASGIVSK